MKEVYAYHNEGNDLTEKSLWQVATQTARDTPVQRNLKDCPPVYDDELSMR